MELEDSKRMSRVWKSWIRVRREIRKNKEVER